MFDPQRFQGISHLDPGYRWAVIAFEKSLVTPAGVDIIAREPALSDADLRHIESLAGPVPLLR